VCHCAACNREPEGAGQSAAPPGCLQECSKNEEPWPARASSRRPGGCVPFLTWLGLEVVECHEVVRESLGTLVTTPVPAHQNPETGALLQRHTGTLSHSHTVTQSHCHTVTQGESSSRVEEDCYLYQQYCQHSSTVLLTLVREDGEHGQRIDDRVGGEGGLQGNPNEVAP